MDFLISRKNFLTNYKKEIRELELLTLAKNRILNYKFDFNDFKKLNIRSFSNYRNFTFAFISFIPVLPNIVFQIKEYLYTLKWK